MRNLRNIRNIRNMKKLSYGLISVIIILTITMTSAYGLNNPLAQVFKQWEQQLTFSNKYVSAILSPKLKSLEKSLNKDLKAAVDEATGVLGIPDSTEVREKVEDDDNSSTTAVNSVERATNEVDRQITRAISNASLSKSGQESTKQNIEKTQDSIKQVESESNAAKTEVVTQDVMKRIAQQNSETAGILGAMRTDGLKLQQSQDLTNVNLTNISRTLDGQNQAVQKEIVGQGFRNLKTASSAKLF